MKFIEVTISTTSEGSELVADIMFPFSSGGVSVYDNKDIAELCKNKSKSWDYIEESLLKASGETLVKGYIPKKIFKSQLKLLNEKLLILKDNCDLDLGALNVSTQEKDGNEWLKSWKENYKPINAGKVVICPKWIKYTPKDNEIIVKMNSGMAFGTGEHETTFMCLELLSKYIKERDTVIDLGCGSGILGITAAKLGALKCYLIDNDYLAADASKSNAKLNKVTAKVDIAMSNLLDENNIVADLIISNITADILINLKDAIGKNIKPGGIIILSGIITEKTEDVIKAYQSAGFNLLEKTVKNAWSALVFKA